MWLSGLLDTHLNPAGGPKAVEVVTVDPKTPPRPYGPIIEGSRLPAQIPDSASYSSPAIRDWSRFVSSCSGFAVLSPEYNGGYPGELKHSLDHLYQEWAGKPVMLVTYGGGGGLRCSAQLQVVLKSLRMDVVEDPVGITLPRTFTGGSERIEADKEAPEFLLPYAESIRIVADRLKERLLVDRSKA